MRTLVLVTLMVIVIAEGGFSDAVAQESAKDIIAAQIRRQGYQCRAPQSAERERAASKPDEAVWLLRCEDATFRVRLVPNLAAKVERVD